ncbi:prolyl 4-hydroxylase 1-like [Papaver somniferum]|uniref:prolyl 4-hydroxylase 1-like n=1 Tax=Papaver somniferum TaxID=3469 RepID=UPI000E6FE543|nr:prolyl 4-hydroxylase 1-like [Papaver somniferum]
MSTRSGTVLRSTRSQTRLQLKANLSTIQRGNSSISGYVTKIKEIADAIESSHEPVSDLELVSITLRGLGDGWIDIYSKIRHRSTPTFSQLHALLLQSNSSSNIQNPSSSLSDSSDCNSGIVSGFACCENDDEAKMLRIGSARLVKPKIISWAPRIIVLQNFLTSEECDYFIAIVRPRLQPYKVQGAKIGEAIPSAHRTSFGTTLSKEDSKNPIVQAIEKRISVFSEVPVENGEPMHVLRYEKNQYYRLHRDYFPDTFNLKQTGGQRTATMVMYLNDNVKGGETYFPMESSQRR